MAAEQVNKGEDIESKGNTTTTITSVPSDEHSKFKVELYEAMQRRDAARVKRILNKVAPRGMETECLAGDENRDPAVLVAMREGLGKAIIRKLTKRTPSDILAKRDSRYRFNALEWAIIYGDVPLAKLLMVKNPRLVETTATYWEYIASLGLKDMAFYLYTIKPITEDEESVLAEKAETYEHIYTQLFQNIGASGLCDFTLLLLERHPKLAANRSVDILRGLVESPHAFSSGTRLHKLASFIYHRIRIKPETVKPKIEAKYSAILEEHLTCQESSDHSPGQVLKAYKMLQRLASEVFQMLIGPIKSIYELKLQHIIAIELVKELSTEIEKNNNKIDGFNVIYPCLLSAIKNGIPKILDSILQVFPVMKNDEYRLEDKKIKLLHLAVDAKIFKMLYGRLVSQANKPFLLGNKNGGYNILEIAAKKPLHSRFDAGGSRVALQVQHELQWYKEVEKLVPTFVRGAIVNWQDFEASSGGDHLNKDRVKLPIELFDEEHQEMVKEEGEWIMNMASSGMVGASLITTVVFAAAITVPGGNRQDGYPNFGKDKAFQVFVLADTFALVSSLTAVMVFFSIFPMRYSAKNLLFDLPNRIIIGLISALLSLTFMMIAFTATVYLMFAEDNYWIVYPATAVACIPVILFYYMQLPSLVRMIKTTYGTPECSIDCN